MYFYDVFPDGGPLAGLWKVDVEDEDLGEGRAGQLGGVLVRQLA